MTHIAEQVTEASLTFESILKQIDHETNYGFHDDLYRVQFALEEAARHLATKKNRQNST